MAKSSWPADKVERRDLKALVPYARNARTHSKAQIDQIAASITRWGWTVPVLVDEKGGVIAGHGRLLAAETLGLETVPVMVARGWSEAQKRAYVIADNQLALNAGWDNDLLAGELRELGEAGFDLSGIGFSPDELSDLLGSGPLADPDVTGPLPDDRYSSQYGVIVICGDEAEQETTYETLAKLGYKCRVVVT